MKPSIVVPPIAFGCVESGVYRGATPRVENIPYLLTLRLRTIVYLSHEAPVAAVRSQYLETVPNVVRLGERYWVPEVSGVAVNFDLVKTALEMVLDVTNHPIMLCCATGVIETGAVVGCLRRIQNWCLSSVLQEYAAFADNLTRVEVMHAIEVFDQDIVSEPPRALPRWYVTQAEQTRGDHIELGQKSPLSPMVFGTMDPRPAYVAFRFHPNCPLLSCRSTFDPKESIVLEDDD